MTDDYAAEARLDEEFDIICSYFTVYEIVRLAIDHEDFYEQLKREAGVNEDLRVDGIPPRGA